MYSFKVKIMSSCKEYLTSLENSNYPKYNKLYNNLCKIIKDIKQDPFNHKFKKLKVSNDLWRARFGNYRIIYFVKDNTIFISRIGLRKNVYKNGKGCEHLLKRIH